MNTPAELCISGENNKQTYAFAEQPDELYTQLRAVFPWAKKENYFSISTPTYHELLNENVITCNIPRGLAVVLFGENVVLAARKFCMSSAKSYIRAYYLHSGAVPDWLPTGCTLMFYSENVEEYGRPYPTRASDFADYYFTGDPATVEEHFELSEQRGAHTTLYGVTREGNTTRRVKQYCYDDEESTFGGWIAVYNHFRGDG